jgi:hypothetical protein
MCAVVAVRSLPALPAHARPRALARLGLALRLELGLASGRRPLGLAGAPPPRATAYEEKQYRRAGICRVSTPKTHQPPKSSSHPPAPRVHFASAYTLFP